MTAFETDSAYEWGKGNPTADQALKRALQLELTPFQSDYVMNPLATLQKLYAADVIVHELQQFKSRSEDVEKLNSLVQKLLRMQAANKQEE